jgi:hypothetical protein
MPELDDSIPVPAVTPPTIDPARWEDFEGFRESFLLHFTRKPDNAALRTVATLLFDLVLEASTALIPPQPEGWGRALVRAAVADLRFLNGFLGRFTQEADGSSLEPYEEHLYRFAGARSAVLAKVADEIEAQLGPWRGESEPAPGREV